MTQTGGYPSLKHPRTRMTALAAGVGGLLLVSGCAGEKATAPIDRARMAMVQIGRSSRADVFAALGRPARTEQSNAGERWVYETGRGSQGSTELVNSVGAATGVVGAFVPYVGLVGSGLSLATAASGKPPPKAGDNLSVDFSPDGIVRDCVYASSAMPAGLPGAPPTPSLGCGRAQDLGRSTPIGPGA